MNTEDGFAEQVNLSSCEPELQGYLVVPPNASGIVLFADGTRSSRISPRNARIAALLGQTGAGVLLFDLLTPCEAEDRSVTSNAPLLAQRMLMAIRWVRTFEKGQFGRKHPIGYLGAGRAADPVLMAAADFGFSLASVVLLGGRIDLAVNRLREVAPPTLLIVGENDAEGLKMNQQVLESLPMGEMVTIPGASQALVEGGAIEESLEEASDWFVRHFKRMSARAASAAA